MKADNTRKFDFRLPAVPILLLSFLLVSCTSTAELLSDAAKSAEENGQDNFVVDASGEPIAVPTEKPEGGDQVLAIASSGPEDEAIAAITAADRSSETTEPRATSSADRGAPPPASRRQSTDRKNEDRGFLTSLFTSSPKEEQSQKEEPDPKPLIDLSEKNRKRPSSIQATIRGDDALPGVRDDFSLFEIVRRSDVGDDSDVDIYEAPRTIQLASAAGLARLAPNGLVRQHSGVDVRCLKPSLVRMLKKIERRFGRKVIVTSGYRNREHNRRVRGARNSYHMYCAAADIQVTGVSKWQLANYVRSLPGRGGVGTYCHTKSIHVDVGPERDWNWRCRRRKK